MVTPDPGMNQALEWIAERLREKPDTDRLAVIDEACRRFSLSPLQADVLHRRLLGGFGAA